jgi:hypothetical protein
MTRSKKASGDYAVGYGKPPVHTRFCKGLSGNPGGNVAAASARQGAGARGAPERIPCFARAFPVSREVFAVFPRNSEFHGKELISLDDRAMSDLCNGRNRPEFRIFAVKLPVVRECPGPAPLAPRGAVETGGLSQAPMRPMGSLGGSRPRLAGRHRDRGAQ